MQVSFHYVKGVLICEYILLFSFYFFSPSVLAESIKLSEPVEPIEHASFVQTPYNEPKVAFEFYFDNPNKINSALFWLRSYINPLSWISKSSFMEQKS